MHRHQQKRDLEEGQTSHVDIMLAFCFRRISLLHWKSQRLVAVVAIQGVKTAHSLCVSKTSINCPQIGSCSLNVLHFSVFCRYFRTTSAHAHIHVAHTSTGTRLGYTSARFYSSSAGLTMPAGTLTMRKKHYAGKVSWHQTFFSKVVWLMGYLWSS